MLFHIQAVSDLYFPSTHIAINTFVFMRFLDKKENHYDS